MSMVRCDNCEDPIDSDDDCDCFTRDTFTDKAQALCGTCREMWPNELEYGA